MGPAAQVACVLETGRTHQIRVHMSAIGAPLIGDPLYGAGFATKANLLPQEAKAAVQALGRQALHAAQLGFAHPQTDEALSFEAPPPFDFVAVFEALSNV